MLLTPPGKREHTFLLALVIPWVICPILKFIELLLRMGSVPCFMAAASSAVCGWVWVGGFE